MVNHFLSRMPLSRRFTVGVGLALVPILVFCYVLLAHEWSEFRRADEAEREFTSLRATLLAMEKVSAERGPMNDVLGEDIPIAAEHAHELARARIETDESIAELLATLQNSNCAGCADVRAMVTKITMKLAVARANVDRLAHLPRAERADRTVQDPVHQMFAIVDDFGPVLILETAAVAHDDPAALNCVFMARLSADLREYAGRLGSHLTGALATHRPLTADEKLAIERARGRIDQLRMMIDTRMAGSATLATQAFTALSTRYFGQGECYVGTVETLLERRAGLDLTTARFAQRYEPTLQPIIGFRDAVLAAGQKELHSHRLAAGYAVVGTAVAEALLLIVLGWIVLKFRRDLVSPFVQATQAIRAIASGDLTKEVPAPAARGEIRDMFDAIKILKENSVERSRLETERDRLMQELAVMADTDSLTRLFNRRAFEKRARTLCVQTHASHVALIMFDIDHFKLINDTYGHAVGDDALRLVAQRCRRNFGPSDIVARIGGEEFAVVTCRHTPHEICETVARMREDIANAAVQTDSGTPCHITASFGIAFATPIEAPDVTHLLKRADRMLYEAKMAGRNRVMVDFGVLPGVPSPDSAAQRVTLQID